MIVLHAERTFDGRVALRSVRRVAARYPGHTDVMVKVGNSRLRLGPAWRIEPSEACLAALSEFGEVTAC